MYKNIKRERALDYSIQQYSRHCANNDYLKHLHKLQLIASIAIMFINIFFLVMIVIFFVMHENLLISYLFAKDFLTNQIL